MNFLTAHKLVKSFKSGPDLLFRLVMSGEVENLTIFLQAHAANKKFISKHLTIPFNTFQQFIRRDSFDNVKNIFVIYPWDLLPSLDWRTGFMQDKFCMDSMLAVVDETQVLLQRVPYATFIYIHAPIPPLSINSNLNGKLHNYLLAAAYNLDARIYTDEAFSLPTYLAHGTPISSHCASSISKAIIDQSLNTTKASCKVLATDLDNVMWRGVIGEDGLENIQFGPAGAGYRHFLYQSYLKRLKSQGILLVAVSRNDSELANLPFTKGNMLLKEEDFISIIASYNAKSAQLEQVAKELNLGLDSIVFIDDNPLEITEVSEQLPMINHLLFPEKDTGLPEFFLQLASFFDQKTISAEDQQRTELYRKRLKGMVPSDVKGGDLTEFLRKLDMKLIVHQRHKDNFDRALQLINKTNQFNLNGIRLEQEDVINTLDKGGRLYTVELEDKNGSHGEILACLIDHEAKIIAYVLSCRVFQRKVEFAFLVWLAKQKTYDKLTFMFSPTNRNIPIQNFFNDNVFSQKENALPYVSTDRVIHHHNKESYCLFQVASDLIDTQ